jgi:hypothetical protein
MNRPKVQTTQGIIKRTHEYSIPITKNLVKLKTTGKLSSLKQNMAITQQN